MIFETQVTSDSFLVWIMICFICFYRYSSYFKDFPHKLHGILGLVSLTRFTWTSKFDFWKKYFRQFVPLNKIYETAGDKSDNWNSHHLEQIPLMSKASSFGKVIESFYEKSEIEIKCFGILSFFKNQINKS